MSAHCVSAPIVGQTDGQCTDDNNLAAVTTVPTGPSYCSQRGLGQCIGWPTGGVGLGQHTRLGALSTSRPPLRATKPGANSNQAPGQTFDRSQQLLVVFVRLGEDSQHKVTRGGLAAPGLHAA